MTKYTASRFRADIYRILEEIIESGEPVEIVRKNSTLRILPEPPTPSWNNDKTPRRNWVRGDPADLVNITWSREWNEAK